MPWTWAVRRTSGFVKTAILTTERMAIADAEHLQASSALDDPYVRAKKRGEKVQLVSRILVAFYFLFSGVFASSSTWAFVVGIGGAASVACGYKFTVAASLLAILVLTHGIGSYLCGNQPVCRVRHRHAIEQVSRRWRGGRRGDSGRTRRKFDFHTARNPRNNR